MDISYSCSLDTIYNHRIQCRCATSGSRSAYNSGGPRLTPRFPSGSQFSIFSFLCSSCRLLIAIMSVFFRPLYFLFFIFFKASDYPFDMFKLFFFSDGTLQSWRHLGYKCWALLQWDIYFRALANDIDACRSGRTSKMVRMFSVQMKSASVISWNMKYVPGWGKTENV